MNTKKKTFKKADIQAAVWGGTDENSLLVLEHSSEWVVESKYQYREHILKDTATGLFYLFGLSRSGSPFTEYIYNSEWLEDEVELTEVHKVTKTVVVWLAVKDK